MQVQRISHYLIIAAICWLPQSSLSQEWIVNSFNQSALDFYTGSDIDNEGNIWICYRRYQYVDTGISPLFYSGIIKVSKFGELQFDTIINIDIYPPFTFKYFPVEINCKGDTILCMMDVKTNQTGDTSQFALLQLWAFSKDGDVLWTKTDPNGPSHDVLTNLERLQNTPLGIHFYNVIYVIDGDINSIEKIYYDPVTKERTESKEFWNNQRDTIFDLADFEYHGNDQYTFWLDHKKVRNVNNEWDTCDVEFIRIQQVTERQDSFEYGAYMDFPALNGGKLQGKYND